MRKATILLSVFLFLLNGKGWAQTKSIEFRHIDSELGLSHNKVYCTYQDSKGFIWIGTREGLNVYDGYQFVTYPADKSSDQGLSSQYIQTIFEDKAGNIWIGTYDGGLNRYDRNTNTFQTFRHDPENKKSLGSDNVYTIYQDQQEQLWIGTYGGGLCLYNEAQQNFTNFKNIPGDSTSLANNAVFDIEEDTKGNLWLATFGGGLGIFDPATHKFIHKPLYTEYGQPINDLYSLDQDPFGNLWIGTYGNGVLQYQLSTEEYQRYTNTIYSELGNDYIVSLNADALGNVWIGTRQGGVSLWDAKKEGFNTFRNTPSKKNALYSDKINQVYLDRQGILWVATDDNGLFTTQSHGIVFENFIGDGVQFPGFSAKSVTAIYEDRQKNLWVGTFGEGVYRFDSQGHKVESFTNDLFSTEGIASNFVTSLVEDHAGRIWMGTLNEGLCRYDPEKGVWKTYAQQEIAGSISNNTINTLLVDKKGNLWVGTDGGGLCLYDSAKDSFEVYKHNPYLPEQSLAGNAIKTIFEDDGSLWVGTKYSGISRLDINTDNIQNYQYTTDGQSYLSSNEIVNIIKDTSGNIWVGTFDKGICKLHTGTGEYISLKTTDGLSSNNICSMQIDENQQIWVSTTKGLNQVNPETHQIQTYSDNDGLYNAEFVQWSFYQNNRNALFLGYLGGFVRFSPSELRKLTVAQNPPVYITSFLLFNQQMQLDTPAFALERIELEHDDNFFEFEFALLDFQSPDENEYAYTMENLNKEWKYVGNRRVASYTNLDAGTYVFKVKARKKNGSWVEVGTPVTIVIHPAWYSTWWFRTMAVCIVLGLGFLYYYNKINTIRERNAQLQELVDARTIELLEKNKEINQQKKSIEAQNERLVEVQEVIKERNKALHDINLELEDRVELRTRELLLANVQLQKANEELDTFVYRSYHDIIGPISRIQGLSYVASLELKDPLALDYFKKLSDNVEHAKSTLLRVLSIYDLRNHEVQLEEFDVLSQIHGLVAQIEKQYDLENISINYEKGFHGLITTDQYLLKTVLSNLIENAAKYSKNCEGSFIHINIKKEDQEVFIQVLDNGHGIPENVRGKVFSMFFRADNHLSGVGLGLYLTKIAIQKIGGTIDYRHTPENETSFELTLKNTAITSLSNGKTHRADLGQQRAK